MQRLKKMSPEEKTKSRRKAAKAYYQKRHAMENKQRENLKKPYKDFYKNALIIASIPVSKK